MSSGNVACLPTISAVYQHNVKDKRLTIGGGPSRDHSTEMGIFDVTSPWTRLLISSILGTQVGGVQELCKMKVSPLVANGRVR
jgi:hypothetical protein